MDNKENSDVGLGLILILTVFFIGLKVMNLIEWSWVWVLSPLWIPIAIVTILLFMMIFVIIFKK